MKKTLALLLTLVIFISIAPLHVYAAGETLDSTAWETLTYRDIFIENNLACMNGFDHGSWNGYTQSAGTNTITDEAWDTPPSSLKAAGTSSQQIVSTVYSPAGDYFVASRVFCTRYVQGKLGICMYDAPVGISTVTNGFVTAAGIVTISVSHRIYVGSIHSADLDGYVDDPVVVNMSIFSTRPSAQELTGLYEQYLEIEKGTDSSEVVHTDTQSLEAFMTYMQKKARSIGMDSSVFLDPVGDTCNWSTARELAKLLIYADRYEQLGSIWSRRTRELTVTGPNERTKTVESSVIREELERYYHILGGKTGTLDNTRNLAVILEIPDSDDRLIVVALGADGSNVTDVNRYQAVKQIADAAMARYRYPAVDQTHVDVCCARAIACLIPAQGTDPEDLQVLYEKDADALHNPASITKVLTAVCALDLMGALDTPLTYTQFDVNTCPWFAGEFYAGDIVMLEDALYALLLPSENVTAFTIARSAGTLLLKQPQGRPGDANGDDKVNSLDLIILRQYLAGWDVTIDTTAADVNNDDQCNSLDLIRLRQYLAGWDVMLE